MQISLDTPDTEIYVKSYMPAEYIQLNQQQYAHSLIISSTNILVAEQLPNEFSELSVKHVEQFLNFNADIYLLGTGSSHQIPHPDLLKVAFKKNKPLDFMDTNAACRTFNVLASEYRNVIALLSLA
ncbi:MTH938/NDUFAF3 family protein [Thiotrichales bacterium 19S3-7]|nr:MTH938/NDUFAF3 family protein [Thiotrichales bacterium 19S3-7]MCF6801454.1 MTH938/NDUFAF3 family protein [Thiotrichales bacterium 19S3-11]